MPAKEEFQEFGEYIKNMRNSVNWTKGQLAKALGVTDRTVKNWENGESLSFHNLNDLAANVRTVIKYEQSRLRKIEEINNQYNNKYLFKGGKVVNV